MNRATGDPEGPRLEEPIVGFDLEGLKGAVSQGLGAQLVSVGPQLNLKSDRVVHRLRLSGGVAPTVIAKVAVPGAGNHAKRLLRREATHLAFVDAIAPGGGLVARRLAFSEGVLLQEDVGDDAGRDRPLAEVTAAVLDALTALHDASASGRGTYVQLHTDADTREVGVQAGASLRRFRAQAALQVDDWGSILGLGRLGWSARCVEAASALEADRSGHVLVHDDCASTRQVRFVGEAARLIDLETARWDHRAFDLARLVMGEVVRSWAADGASGRRCLVARWRAPGPGLRAALDSVARPLWWSPAAARAALDLLTVEVAGAVLQRAATMPVVPSLPATLGALFRHRVAMGQALGLPPTPPARALAAALSGGLGP